MIKAPSSTASLATPHRHADVFSSSRNDGAKEFTRSRASTPKAPDVDSQPPAASRSAGAASRPPVLPYPAQGSGGMPMPTASLPYPAQGSGGMPMPKPVLPYPQAHPNAMPMAPFDVLPLQGFVSPARSPEAPHPEEATWL